MYNLKQSALGPQEFSLWHFHIYENKLSEAFVSAGLPSVGPGAPLICFRHDSQHLFSLGPHSYAAAHKTTATTTATNATTDITTTAKVASPDHDDEHGDESSGWEQSEWTLPQAEPGPSGPGLDALMEHTLPAPFMQ